MLKRLAINVLHSNMKAGSLKWEFKTCHSARHMYTCLDLILRPGRDDLKVGKQSEQKTNLCVKCHFVLLITSTHKHISLKWWSDMKAIDTTLSDVKSFGIMCVTDCDTCTNCDTKVKVQSTI